VAFRKPDEFKCLARLVDGWQLRVPPWLPGGGYTRFFGDAKYGGSNQALEACRAERDGLFAEAELSFDPGGKRTFSRSSTLIVGVCLASTGRRPNGRPPARYWGAYWSDATGQKRKLFSVERLGFFGAWEEAVAERLRRVKHKYSDAEIELARAQCVKLWLTSSPA
jgi:hypothetical protein